MRIRTQKLVQFAQVFTLLALTFAGTGIPAQAQTKPPVVFAAASLKTALHEAAQAWAREAGKPAPRISYAGSNALAKQIENGAPADLFLSADTDWMDYLANRALIQPQTQVNLLTNRLALIAPKGSSATLPRNAQGDLAEGANLAALFGNGRLATAHVEAVPAGKYGKAALEHLGLWAQVRERLAQAENVRAALLLVARGEVPLGLVYTSDAMAEPYVVVLATLPESAHPPIIYPAALVAGAHHADAAAFLTFLQSDGAAGIFTKHGFGRIKPPAKAM